MINMKRLVFVSFFASAVIIASAQEQPGPEFQIPRTLIKLSPLQLFNNTLELSVESFNPAFSKSFQASVGLRSSSSDYSNGKGVSVEVGYRKYVSPMKYITRKQRTFYQGIYYSLFVNGNYFKGDETDAYYYDPNTGQYSNSIYTEEIYSISPGFIIGLQKTLWKVIFLDMYVGGGIRFTDVSRSGDTQYRTYYTITDAGYEGIYPKIGVKIGVGL
jgi:hypothetical protein